MLMRSWVGEAGLVSRAGWVSVDSEQRDPQGFWISVADALRGTAAGSGLVRPLTAAPVLDGWAVVERLLTDLAALDDRLWLVIDDVHLLGSGEVLAQLELLVLRAPPELRFVIATRRDLRLGLHRLRVEGELTEIRAADLRFSLAEARALFAATGAQMPEETLARLHGRTEGWAAGLRLAALSLAGHPDPERFAAEFSGTDRTVAEFLLAEVLDRQSEAVRLLLLRTSVLERVCGPLADVLTGGSGGERILQDLEQAGAFVVSLDGSRSWFRYHQLFADLLQLELRRTEPQEQAALHAAAAGWLAGHGHPVEAVRQAQAAGDWGMATRLLSEHWLDLYLAGRGATLVGLLAGFPRRVVAASPELTTVQVAGDLVRGALEDAGRHLATAAGAVAAVPAERRGHVQVMLAVLRLFLARRFVDFPVVVEEARRLLALTEAVDAAHLGPSEDLRAAALISLGIAEMWTLPLRGRGSASGAGGGAGAPDRAAVPGVHRAGARGARVGAVPSRCVARGVEQAGDRAGGTAWLGGGAARRGGLRSARHHESVPGTAGGSRAVAGAGRAHPAYRGGTGGGDEPALCARGSGAGPGP